MSTGIGGVPAAIPSEGAQFSYGADIPKDGTWQVRLPFVSDWRTVNGHTGLNRARIYECRPTPPPPPPTLDELREQYVGKRVKFRRRGAVTFGDYRVLAVVARLDGAPDGPWLVLEFTELCAVAAAEVACLPIRPADVVRVVG